MNQDIIVFVVLALVVSYLIYSGIRSYYSKKSGKCSGCCGCSASEEINRTLKQKRGS